MKGAVIENHNAIAGLGQHEESLAVGIAGNVSVSFWAAAISPASGATDSPWQPFLVALVNFGFEELCLCVVWNRRNGQ